MNILDIIIPNFNNAKLLEKLKLPLITVYNHPNDYPNKWVARLFDINKPTNYVVIANDYEEIINNIPAYMTRLPPDAKDDVNITDIFL